MILLSDVTCIIMGQSPKSSSYNEDGKGLPFYQGKAEFGDNYPIPVKWCRKPGKIAEKGDILISVRAPVGPTNICQERSCIGRGLAAVRALGGMQTQYLRYWLSIKQLELEAKSTGTTFQAISGETLRSLGINIHPLPEQKRIVAKIESLFSRLDSAKDSLVRVSAEIKRYRQAVLKWASEGKLTEEWRRSKNIPASQEKKLFRDVIEKIAVNGKKVKQKNYLKNGFYPVIDQGQEFVGGYTNDGDSKIIVDKPVIVFGDHTRIIKLVSFDFAPGADGIKVFRPLSFYNIKYFMYMLNILKLPDKGYARHYQYLEDSKIPFVTLKEQKQVVKEIACRFDHAKMLEGTVDQVIEQVERLKQSILKKAFEGKLVELDPNDEPVEILLERIKKEKAKLLTTTIRKRKK